MKSFKSKKQTVSLCMIVKDEEQYLADCLRSVHDVVDEIIIVDTGSTDKTVDIAKEFDARVFHYCWNDDFAAARNESIKHATSDWILQIDADERLDESSKGELKSWLKNKSKMCVNVVIDSPKSQYKKGHISRAHRLFRNLPGIRYSGRIHEQISPSVVSLKGQEGFSNIRLLHLGYAKSEKEMQEKSQRNYELLKRQIDDEPDNGYWHFTLAQNLILNKKYDEASEHLHTALRIGGLPRDIGCSIYNNLAEIHMKKAEYDKAIQFAEKALSITNEQTTSYLILCEIYGYLKDNRKQIGCLEATLKLVEKNKRVVNKVSLEAYVDSVALNVNLANKYLTEKEYQRAEGIYQTVLKEDKSNLSALKGLGDCYLGSGEFEKAKVYLEQVNVQQPEDVMTLEKLGWILIKLQQYPQAIDIYKRLLDFAPDNVKIQKRLAALYYEIGAKEESKKYLLASQSHAATTRELSF